MSKSFILTMFVNSCNACFDIVGGIVLCTCCSETKTYNLAGCLPFGLDYALCILDIEIGNAKSKVLMPP